MDKFTKPKASDFYSRHAVAYPAHVNRYGFASLKVLEFLVGHPWDDIALAYVHALRPGAIRVVRDEETMDSWPWRVTVYVSTENGVDVIEGIRQEVEVWLPDGVENGYELGRRAKEAL